MDDINDISKVAKVADSIVLTFSVPKATQFISWFKFNGYMMNNIYQVEQALDISDTEEEVQYTINERSDSSRYTASDVSELRVGDQVIYNNPKGSDVFIGDRDDTLRYLSSRMKNPTGKVIIIPSDEGNEYKFYTSEHKYYYVRPYCNSGTN